VSESHYKLAFILFKYFPYGGLQRDFMNIARIAIEKGNDVDVYTLEWSGDIPDGINVNVVNVKALSNHAKYEKFVTAIELLFETKQYDCIIGFNKIPGLDIYYAADPCYVARVKEMRSFWYKWTKRYRHFAMYEKAVFAKDANTEILLIANKQLQDFERNYHTPSSRLHLLPPGIQRDRLRSSDQIDVAKALRQEIGIASTNKLVLMVGSGFRIKGLDRTLKAIAALPDSLRETTQLVVIGKDNIQPFMRMAKKLGLEKQLCFFAGRDDIPRFLAAADILIHPAYSESAGIVLLEALAAGLPILTTDVCGYAHYIDEAKGGVVLSSPFSQHKLNDVFADMLSDTAAREKWAQQGHAWAKVADIYDLHQHAYDIIIRKAGENKVRAGDS